MTDDNSSEDEIQTESAKEQITTEITAEKTAENTAEEQSTIGNMFDWLGFEIPSNFESAKFEIPVEYNAPLDELLF